jgi:hypothetical protein
MSLRSSNFPKLALCACYQSDPNPGPAAERGSSLDALFRARMAGLPEQHEMFYQPNEADLDAVEWAVTTLKALAGGADVLTRENDCRVVIPGLQNPGTADAIIPEKLAHADLKTGQKRNYREQMAGYALGLMEAHFATEWTAHLLFCDQKEVVTHRFTFEEARSIVEAVIARFNDPNKTPTPCEYCGWCAKRETCPARLVQVGSAITAANPGFDFAAVLSDNAKLGMFLNACSVLDDYREQAETTAKERLGAGQEIPGWKLSTRRGPEFVDAITVGQYISQMGFGPVLAAYGNLSAKKFRDLWAVRMPSGKPFPEEHVKHGKATTSLRACKTTTQPTTN